MTRNINVKFLVILMVTVAVLATATHFLHGYQVKRHAEAFLQQADREEKDGEPARAADYLRRYLRHKPTDVDTMLRLGNLLEEKAKTPRERGEAFLVLENVVRLSPDREEVRRRLVKSALGMELYLAAIPHIEYLLKNNATEADLYLQLARCYEFTTDQKGEFQYLKAEKNYLEATQHDPRPVVAFERRAFLLRQMRNDAKEADRCIDDLFRYHPKSAQAHLAKARYRKKYPNSDDPREAQKAIDEAQKLAPGDSEVLFVVGQLKQEDGQLEQALACYEDAVKNNPKDPKLYLALSDVEIRRGKFKEAAKDLRRGLEALPSNLDLLGRLLDVLITDNQRIEAREVVGKLRGLGARPEILRYFEAYLEYTGDDWHKGLIAMEQVRPQLTRYPTLARQADVLLAQGAMRLADPDKAISHYTRATGSTPLDPNSRTQLAATLLSAGRVEEAAVECRKLVSLPDAPPGSWLLLAHALYRRNLALPPQKREWREVDQALNKAAENPQTKDAPHLYLLRADILISQGQIQPGKALLEQLRDKHPKMVEVWRQLIEVAERPDVRENSQDILEQAQKAMGDTVDMRLLRARYWSRRRGEAAQKQILALKSDLEKFTPAEQQRLRSGLAEACFATGDLVESERLWKEVAQRDKDNLPARVMLFEVALVSGRTEELQGRMEAIKQVEGKDGTLWRSSDAARLIHLARKETGDRQAQLLDAASRHLSEISRRRASWVWVSLGEAEIAEVRGDRLRALEAYQRAFNNGEDSPRMILRMVRLHRERGHPIDADELLRKVAERNGLPGILGYVAAEVALEVRDFERALRVALMVVPAESKEFRDYIWLSQFHRALNKPKEAELSLKRATDLAPKESLAWQARMLYYAGSRKAEEVDKILKEARAQLPAEEMNQLAAQANEVLGRYDVAEKEYTAALSARPDDPQRQRQLAALYLRSGAAAKAYPLLEKLQTNPQVPQETVLWARRNMAIGVSARGSPGDAKKAMEMIEQNLREGKGRVEDMRAKAVIVASQPGMQDESLRLLVESQSQGPLAPQELALMAQLYRFKRDWPKQRDALQALVTADERNTANLGYFIAELLANNETSQARFWVERLKKVDPTSLTTVALEARLEHAEGRTSAAVQRLHDYAKKAGSDSYLAVGMVFEALNKLGESEEYLRKAPFDQKHPETALRLLAFLGRRNRVADVLDVLDRAWKSGMEPDFVAGGTLAVLGLIRLNPEECKRVEKPLEAALQKNEKSTALLCALAVIREFHEGRPAEAIPLYRKALQVDPKNVTALNNLALLLALHEGKPDEAMDLIGRALESAGTEPPLLDTRGVVRLAAGKLPEALGDFRSAVVAGPSPYRFFHLAQAELAAKERKAAEGSFARARELGLRRDHIHPVERAAYDRLVVDLTVK
jgi:tetratricopeptide (TPR) repeat protein